MSGTSCAVRSHRIEKCVFVRPPSAGQTPQYGWEVRGTNLETVNASSVSGPTGSHILQDLLARPDYPPPGTSRGSFWYGEALLALQFNRAASRARPNRCLRLEPVLHLNIALGDVGC